MTISPLLGVAMLVADLMMSAATSPTIPADIRAHLARNGCSEIADYYAEQHVAEKPYLYGVRSILSGKRGAINDYSFLAWCRSNNKEDEGQYVLMADLKGAVWPGGCGFPIVGQDYPGGVSLSVKTIDLSSFLEPSNARSKKGRATGPVIRSEKDGLVLEIFCHRKVWVTRNTD